jgi:hypothetical protein
MQLADVVYPLVVIAFFALAAALVFACDRIIGADETVVTADETGTSPEERAA